jgi:hypothetical protein
MSGQLHAPAALPLRTEPAVLIIEKAGWAPDPVWMQCQRERIPAWNQTPVIKPVA